MFDSVSSVALSSALDGLAAAPARRSPTTSRTSRPPATTPSGSTSRTPSPAVGRRQRRRRRRTIARSLEPTRLNGNNVNLDTETLLERRHQPALPAGAAAPVDGKFCLLRTAMQGELMTIFDAIGIAGTGLTVHRKWLDAVSDNIANVNTVRAHERGRRSRPGTSSPQAGDRRRRRRPGRRASR